ncbi:hypothetical protein PHYPO_G00062760 [Pangasianodon hypophthalmus]|uniref:Uncharacterized protein n=1 Tax=Pangasianodon hypophthalmus TaxID=310915 RepID=A0A5N5M1U7_PANHP|nr:hypothetical protein PHYPO_G00062760 [Pangasianodon hypophthalmus]
MLLGMAPHGQPEDHWDCWGWCRLGAVEMAWGSHMGNCTVMAWDCDCHEQRHCNEITGYTVALFVHVVHSYRRVLFNTICYHPDEDGFPFESGSSQFFFLMLSQGVFPCHSHLWLAH